MAHFNLIYKWIEKKGPFVCSTFKPVIWELMTLKCVLMRNTFDMMLNYKQEHNDDFNCKLNISLISYLVLLYTECHWTLLVHILAVHINNGY
jgi:hypothetical protein